VICSLEIESVPLPWSAHNKAEEVCRVGKEFADTYCCRSCPWCWAGSYGLYVTVGGTGDWVFLSLKELSCRCLNR